MITKTAEVLLNAHQQRVVDKLDNQPGLIAFHSLGSGKTLTSLSAAKKQLDKSPNKDVLFVVPASLVANVHKEIDKHGLDIDKNRLHVVSYEKAVRNIDALKKKEYSLVVADEAHRLRNSGTKRVGALRDLLSTADKRLLLSGTVSYNKVGDAARLVNLAANSKVLPDTDKDFEERFIEDRIVPPKFFKKLLGAKPTSVQRLKNTKELRQALGSYVDHYDATTDMQHLFPNSTLKKVQVAMDKDQQKYYDFVLGQMPERIRSKVQAGLPMSKKELAELNTFATGVRQVSDSVSPYVGKTTVSPKIREAANSMLASVKNTDKFRGVVYSNYLEAGLKPYRDYLKQQGVDADMFTGALSAKDKKSLVDSFNDTNDPKPKVLLLSSSGGEGLDLKGTRKLQVLEPHFNPSKIDQVVGRAIRYKSHEHLPEDARSVDVEHYQTVYPETFANKWLKTKKKTAIDEYLLDLSDKKGNLNRQLKALVTSR